MQREIGRFLVGRHQTRRGSQSQSGESEAEHIACVPQVEWVWQGEMYFSELCIPRPRSCGSDGRAFHQVLSNTPKMSHNDFIEEGNSMASGSSARPKVNPIPDGYHSVTPYLTVADADRLMSFVKSAFGAQELFAQRGPDGAIQHAEARIGDSIVMMGRVSGEAKPLPGMIYLYVPDVDAVYRAALGAGGKSLQEPADMFYGDRRAAVEDPCGNQWYMATHIEDVSPEELRRRAAAQAQKQ